MCCYFWQLSEFNSKIKLKKTWAATETDSPLFLNIFLVYVFIYANILRKKTRKKREKTEKQEKIQTNYNTRFGKRDVQFGFFSPSLSVVFFVSVLNLNFICRAELNIQLALDLPGIYYIVLILCMLFEHFDTYRMCVCMCVSECVCV